MIYDYCILGQGLAGSALAFHLLKRNRKFLVIDLPNENKSSAVAAGIYNPITGKNWVKTWKADELFPFMHSFYMEVENSTGAKFLNDRLIFRPFMAFNDQNDWMGKSESPFYSDFIHKVHTDPIDTEIVHNPMGGLEIDSGGSLNIPEYLSAIRKLLIANECFKEEHFELTEVKIGKDTCKYREFEFKKIIFCQGPEAASYDLWKFLPFQLVKGEILIVNIKEEINKIYNKGVFILPSGKGTCRVGATYDNNNLDTVRTEKGKNQLIDKLDGFFKPKYQFMDQIAGIRPATVDRKPFMGMHPNDEKLVIFNGLGAKGVTLAPYFANHLLDYMENDCFLMKEVDLNRFID